MTFLFFSNSMTFSWLFHDYFPIPGFSVPPGTLYNTAETETDWTLPLVIHGGFIRLLVGTRPVYESDKISINIQIFKMFRYGKIILHSSKYVPLIVLSAACKVKLFRLFMRNLCWYIHKRSQTKAKNRYMDKN